MAGNGGRSGKSLGARASSSSSSTSKPEKPKRKLGRPRSTPEQRKRAYQKKLEVDRERRARVKAERERVKAKMAAAGITGLPARERKELGSRLPRFKPTSEDRVRVQTLAGLGLRHDEIALQVVNPATGEPLSESKLREAFPRELALGPSQSTGKVSESLYRMATGTGGVKRNVAAAIFWLKARAGWNETSRVEVDVRSGVLVAPARLSPEEWVARAGEADRGKGEPGANGADGSNGAT